MNALNAQGNMAGRPGGDGHAARAATAIRPRCDEQVCRAFPQLVIFLKHESGFGRLDERWDMSGSS
ncbi:hypothetical protein GYN07_11465 [Rhizobium leguminosarum bv. viciae 248]|uniref:hypothetical protein n=1 Tax=Rhizobium leguminosarum TaxID=384 RepID=UPI0013995DA4|nr:hypothetical protein [Rhizobium leguminosarum]MCA2408193.1 hypothetical protein [Rhizobium leguminosarum]QHW22797.1 hypothetical protein GYN07_11465 [Rhizobium leguminosarum bv. viciae 248]